jgi:nitroreductase
MDLRDAMRTTFACRYYLPDPVPEEVFFDAVEAARFGPQGGNRQPVRFLIVRDAEKKRALGELYLKPWRRYIEATAAGQAAIEVAKDEKQGRATWSGLTDVSKALRQGNDFAEAFAEHPAIVVVCADLSATHPTDTNLGRLSIVGGASVYPTVQNFCLALRDLGVATTFTTLAVELEEEVRALLGIPPELATACHIAAGYPRDGFPKRLRRRPVEELAFLDDFETPLRDPRDSAS